MGGSNGARENGGLTLLNRRRSFRGSNLSQYESGNQVFERPACREAVEP